MYSKYCTIAILKTQYNSASFQIILIVIQNSGYVQNFQHKSCRISIFIFE